MCLSFTLFVEPRTVPSGRLARAGARRCGAHAPAKPKAARNLPLNWPCAPSGKPARLAARHCHIACVHTCALMSLDNASVTAMRGPHGGPHQHGP